MLRSLYLLSFLLYVFPAISQPSPEARVCANLVYHQQLGKVLLLDGYIRDASAGKTKIWSWEGDGWKLISTNGPLARSFGGVAYDSKRNKIVLFGGRYGSAENETTGADTWEWDGANWKEISHSSEPLTQRDHIAMTYDESRSATILMGGVQYDKRLKTYIWLKDAWNWDGKTWSQLKTQSPFKRFSSVVYDSKRHELVVFGVTHDEESETVLNETWIWNGIRWRKHNGMNPPARSGAMSVDHDKGVIYLYGGWTKSGERRAGDMWQWNGSEWKQLQPPGNTPGKRGGHSMAYDANRKKIILFGGEDDSGPRNDTWEWDGIKWQSVN